jgi:hypothetical protein
VLALPFQRGQIALQLRQRIQLYGRDCAAIPGAPDDLLLQGHAELLAEDGFLEPIGTQTGEWAAKRGAGLSHAHLPLLTFAIK